jgi:hypothetical protein
MVDHHASARRLLPCCTYVGAAIPSRARTLYSSISGYAAVYLPASVPVLMAAPKQASKHPCVAASAATTPQLTV